MSKKIVSKTGEQSNYFFYLSFTYAQITYTFHIHITHSHITHTLSNSGFSDSHTFTQTKNEIPTHFFNDVILGWFDQTFGFSINFTVDTTVAVDGGRGGGSSRKARQFFVSFRA